MSGHPDSLMLSFAQSANPHTGIPIQRRIWIYGLYSLDGFCHYVGQTANRAQRKDSHRAKRPSLEFRVIRSCDEWKAHVIERQIILAYKKRGHCQLNASTTARPVRNRQSKPIFCCEVNRAFESVAHAAEELKISDSSIYQYLREPSVNVMRFYYLDYYLLNLPHILDYSI